MAAVRYNLTGTKGVPFVRQLTVNLRAGTVDGANFFARVFNRHDETGAIVAAATVQIVDPETNLIEMNVSATEMNKLNPDTIYAYQIEGEAADQFREILAHGRFYVNPRYS